MSKNKGSGNKKQARHPSWRAHVRASDRGQISISSRRNARTPLGHDALAEQLAIALKKANTLGFDDAKGLEVSVRVNKNGAEIKIKKPLTGLRKQWDKWVVQPYEKFNKLTMSTTGALVIGGVVFATALGQSTTDANGAYDPNAKGVGAPHSDVVSETSRDMAGEWLKARLGPVAGSGAYAAFKEAVGMIEARKPAPAPAKQAPRTVSAPALVQP